MTPQGTNSSSLCFPFLCSSGLKCFLQTALLQGAVPALSLLLEDSISQGNKQHNNAGQGGDHDAQQTLLLGVHRHQTPDKSQSICCVLLPLQCQHTCKQSTDMQRQQQLVVRVDIAWGTLERTPWSVMNLFA